MKRNTKKIVSEVKDEGKTIGSIKFGKFIPEKVYRVDFEAEENVMETFAKYGLEKIKDDQEALVSYAINKLLKDMIESCA